MKTFLLAVTLVMLTACGPDSILVESGTRHACRMVELQVQLAANPGDESVQAELAEAGALLEANIDTAEEGNRAELQAAIQAAVVEGGCD